MPPRPWTPPPAAAPRSPARSTDARPAARRSRPSPGPRSTRAATSRSPSRTRPAAAPSGGTTAEVVNGSGGHVISDGVWNSDGVHDAGYEQNAGTVTDSAGGQGSRPEPPPRRRGRQVRDGRGRQREGRRFRAPRRTPSPIPRRTTRRATRRRRRPAARPRARRHPAPRNPRRSGSPSRGTGRPTTARSGSRTSCTCATAASSATPAARPSTRRTDSMPIATRCMLKVRTMMATPTTHIPQARTRDITSSRRPVGTGSWMWPGTGSRRVFVTVRAPAPAVR